MIRQFVSQSHHDWLSRALRMSAVLLLLAFAISAIALSNRPPTSAEAQQTATPIDPWPRPVYIVAGDCANPGDVAWPLNNLTSPDGDAAGSADTDRTEYSFTSNVPLTIPDLLAGGYAIQVHERSAPPQRVIACGNVGGVPDGVGTLVVGLRWQSGLDVSGIAVLSPSPADATRTLISVFISGPSLGHETGNWTEPTAVPTTPVPGDETPVVNPPTDEAEPTEIEVEPTEIEVEPTEDDDGGHGGDDDGGDDHGGHGGDDGGGHGGDDGGSQGGDDGGSSGSGP